MRLLNLCLTLLAWCEVGTSHESDEAAGYQEPFVGWTKEDLDAKWGTDVSSMSTINIGPILSGR